MIFNKYMFGVDAFVGRIFSDGECIVWISDTKYIDKKNEVKEFLKNTGFDFFTDGYNLSCDGIFYIYGSNCLKPDKSEIYKIAYGGYY